jgi:outer membrane protein TolC
MQFPQGAGRAVVATFWLAVLCFTASDRLCGAAEKNDAKDRMKALLKERVDNAKAIYELMLTKYEHGAGNVASVHRAKMAWLNARLSIAETKAERVKLYEEIVKDSKEWEQTALRNVENGAGEQIEALTARAERIEAEIALETARAEPEPEKIPPPKQ